MENKPTQETEKITAADVATLHVVSNEELNEAAAAEPRVVAGVLTVAYAENAPGLGDLVEAAQVKATEDALAEGVSVHDGKELVYRKVLAHKATKAAYEAMQDLYAAGNGKTTIDDLQSRFAGVYEAEHARLKTLPRAEVIGLPTPEETNDQPAS